MKKLMIRINEFNRKFEEGLNTSGDMRQFIGNRDEIL